MKEPRAPQASGYSINVASRRSGLGQDTLRAWERRYGALRPARTEGGHRLYSERDVDRMRLLRLATEVGHRIGQIAGLDDAVLIELLRDDALHSAEELSGNASARSSAVKADPRLAAGLQAVEDLDGVALQRVLEQASVDLPRTLLVDGVLAPLVEAIGEGYDQGRLRPAHEHLASAVIVAFGQSFRAAFAVPPSAPCLVATTPALQHHELGAVLAGAVAAAEGWHVVYLGPSLPAEDIAAVAQSKSATVVALSLVFPPDDPLLADEIRRLRRLLDRRIVLVVGGRASAAYRAVLDEVGAERVHDFASFRRRLGELRSARAAEVPRNGRPMLRSGPS